MRTINQAISEYLAETQADLVNVDLYAFERDCAFYGIDPLHSKAAYMLARLQSSFNKVEADRE